mgnify:CR=1 FL=1
MGDYGLGTRNNEEINLSNSAREDGCISPTHGSNKRKEDDIPGPNRETQDDIRLTIS